MDQIIIEGVRCFCDRQEAPIRPITLLVGENSSGKSTFLSMVRIAWDLCQRMSPVNFNEEPFLLGTYDQIASYRGGRAGRAKCLRIGAGVQLGGRKRPDAKRTLPDRAVVEGCFTPDGQSKATEWTLNAGPFRVHVDWHSEDGKPSATLTMPTGSVRVEEGPILSDRFHIVPDLVLLLRLILREGGLKDKSLQVVEGQPSQSDLDMFGRLVEEFRYSLGRRPYAFAPIRTRPQRTYEPLDTFATPEGHHVPVVLAKALASEPKEWQRLREAIDRFGSVSGLFEHLDVRRLGRKESDPFQLRVKISGPAFNVLDVGYGVSQALPLVVDSLREPSGSTFLLQQPEVHLHPKAQAELGSFLAALARQQHKRFVIETHSDYLVDRIRMDVRDRKSLTPADVAILYFERQNGEVKIRSLEIDEAGNLVNVPTGYRQFFLEEEKRFIGC